MLTKMEANSLKQDLNVVLLKTVWEGINRWVHNVVNYGKIISGRRLGTLQGLILEASNGSRRIE